MHNVVKGKVSFIRENTQKTIHDKTYKEENLL